MQLDKVANMVKKPQLVLAKGGDETVVLQQPISNKREKWPLTSMIREVVAIFFWLYVIVKPFIFDFDIFLFNKFFPKYVRLLNFKSFFLLLILAIILLTTRKKPILLWSLYILFYPMIFFVKICFFVVMRGNWNLTVAFVNAIVSFFKSVKYNFITLSFFLVSTAIIFNTSNKILLWTAICTLLFLLTLTYINKFILIIKPSNLFEVYTNIFSAIKRHGMTSPAVFALDDNIKKLSINKLDQTQFDKWKNNLSSSVLFNRICLFAAKKLRDYQSSGINIISYVLIILLLVLITIFSFATINYGLYKINNSHFNLSSSVNFFTFFYYSFNNLIFSAIQQVTPVTTISQSIYMIESFFALVLIAIFVSLFFSIKNQRHLNELNLVISKIEEEGKSMEVFIKEEYKIKNIYEAIKELEKLKVGIAKFIYTVSENIK